MEYKTNSYQEVAAAAETVQREFNFREYTGSQFAMMITVKKIRERERERNTRVMRQPDF